MSEHELDELEIVSTPKPGSYLESKKRRAGQKVT